PSVPTAVYTLSLHDALPIYRWQGKSFLAWLYTIARNAVTDRRRRERPTVDLDDAYGVAEEGPTAHDHAVRGEQVDALRGAVKHRSEEHTSELQSLRHLVCRL